MNDIKICVLGGDMRQLYAAREMSKKGYTVKTFGLSERFGINEEEFLANAVYGASLILLPLPFSTDKIRFSCPISNKDIKLEELYENVSKGQIVAGGKLTNDFCEKIKAKGGIPFDYYKSEFLSIMNAVPTSEGAVAIAINETSETLFGSKCAVIGYGRIGKILSRTLKALGGEVSVFARSECALAWAKADGFNSIDIANLKDRICDKKIIFNTAPAMVLPPNVLDCANPNTVIIDLASSPGGVDADYAKKKGIKVIFALSLPGKVAPESAGKIIADTIETKIKEVVL